MSRFVAHVAETITVVSALDPCISIDVDLRLSPHQLRGPVMPEDGGLYQRKRPSVCANIMTVFAFIYRALVVKKAGEGTPTRSKRDGTKIFGARVKATLGVILCLYADRKVCLHPLIRNYPLTNTSLGICRCREQD